MSPKTKTINRFVSKCKYQLQVINGRNSISKKMAFNLLPFGGLEINRNKQVKLSAIPRNHNINVLFPALNYIFRYDEAKFQQEFKTVKVEEDVKNYLLSTSELENIVQEEID